MKPEYIIGGIILMLVGCLLVRLFQKIIENLAERHAIDDVKHFRDRIYQKGCADCGKQEMRCMYCGGIVRIDKIVSIWHLGRCQKCARPVDEVCHEHL